MKVSLCGAGLGGERLSFLDFANLASSTGFDGFDCGPEGALDAITTFGLEDIRTKLASLGVVPAVFGLDVEWRYSDDAFASSIIGFEARVQAMTSLGCSRCCTWIPPSSSELSDAWYVRTVDRLKRIINILDRYGVRLGLEFVGPHHLRAGGLNAMGAYPTIWNLQQTLSLISDIGCPSVGLLIDTYHLDTTGTDVSVLNTLGDGLIVHAHINDAPLTTTMETARDGERVLPGTGRLPLQDFVTALEQLRYSGYICCEVLSATPLGYNARVSANNIRQSLRQFRL